MPGTLHIQSTVEEDAGVILTVGEGTQKVYSTSNSLACDALKSSDDL